MTFLCWKVESHHAEVVAVDAQALTSCIPAEEPSRLDVKDFPSRSPSRGLFLMQKSLLVEKPLRWEAHRCHQCKIGDDPILAESDSDEEDGEKATLVHTNSGKVQGKVDSAQSKGIEATALTVDLDSREGASEQNIVVQPTLTWLEKAAVGRAMWSGVVNVEIDREATEKVVEVIDAAMDDLKQAPNLACVATDVRQTCSPSEIRGRSRSPNSISLHAKVSHLLDTSSKKMSSTEKVDHFLKSISSCGSISSTDEEQSACLQQISTDSAAEWMNSQTLDGVWLLDDGEPLAIVKGSGVKLPEVAVVKGSDVKFLGDGAPDFTFQLEPLGAGVWAITMDDEEFLSDCSEREDGSLVLHWSNGLTWVRKKEGTEIDTLTNISSSSSSSSSCYCSHSRSCSSSSSYYSSESSTPACSSVGLVEAGRISDALEIITVGATAEFVPAAKASKAGGTIAVDEFEAQVFNE